MIGSLTQRTCPRPSLSVERLESRDCPAAYSIVDLLPAPGGLAHSEAYAVNDGGVAVGRGLQQSGYGQAAVWPAGTGSTRAGTFLPMRAGDNYSEANDVNNAGMIAGVSGVIAVVNQAAVWTGDGASYAVHDLASLGGSFTHDYASGLSDPDDMGATWVVGGSYYDAVDSLVRHPTVWRVGSDGNTLSTIDLEPAGPTNAWTTDVRIVGSSVYVVGGYAVDDVTYTARVWTLDLAGNVLARTDLGTLGGPSSSAESINSDGHVAGGSTQATGGANFGFIHRAGVMTSLGSLGDRGSVAAALNDSETVVGTYFKSSRYSSLDQPYAFVWRDGTMLDLRGQLGKSDKASWPRLQHAGDVNATGQIVGIGNVVKKPNRTETHGFLMTPPALHASATGAASETTLISSDNVQPLLREALDRWQAAGFDTSALGGLDVRIADLGGSTLGLASGNTIWLDDNAAGWGWYVDATPWDDSEFTTPGDQGEQNRMDLLTVVMHELGHLLGYGHNENGVMAETLAAGVRNAELGSDEALLVDRLFMEQANQQRAEAWPAAWLQEQFDATTGQTKRRR
jgi:uncharacterized membrane protein